MAMPMIMMLTVACNFVVVSWPAALVQEDAQKPEKG